MNGNKLRKIRESKGLLQKEVADALKISTSTIGMYEQNRREPDNDTLKKIANFFEVSTDYLLDNTPQKSDEEEIEILRQLLIKCGYMKPSEDLTKKEFNNLMIFINANKEFLKNGK